MTIGSRTRRRLFASATATALAALTSACTSASLQLPDPMAGGVTGVLFVDANHNDQYDRGEAPLGGWRVGAFGTGPLPLQETTTDDDGRFIVASISGLADDRAVLKYAPHVVAPGAFDASTSQLQQSLDVRLGESVAVPVDDFTLCEELSKCPEVRLPDLVPILDLGEPASSDYPGTKEWYLDTQEKPGRVLLRFASMTSNGGDGLLHVVALDPPSDSSTQPVQQRVYGDHTLYARTAGNFVYHPTHEHFHLDRFETYELHPAGSPNVVASGTKVSFCLTDNAAVPDRPPAPPAALSLNLPPMSCGTREQGISPGFTDYYGPRLPDQWVDVTDVPTGDYSLVLTSDPDDVLLESDETNNTISLPLHYTNPLK